MVTTLSEQIDLLEKRLQEEVGEQKEHVLLTSVPGILATIILLETGTNDRFATVGNLPPTRVASTASTPATYLSWAFIEAANFAQRFNAEAKRFYERKKAKTNTAVATKALAHKLARACYHMLKEQKLFDAGRCFARVTTASASPERGLAHQP